MVEGERDKYDNDEHVYFFPHGESTCNMPRMEFGMGLGGWEIDWV